MSQHTTIAQGRRFCFPLVENHKSTKTARARASFTRGEWGQARNQSQQQDGRRRRRVSHLTLRNSSWSPPASSTAAAAATSSSAAAAKVAAAAVATLSLMFALDAAVAVTAPIRPCPSTIQRRFGSTRKTRIYDNVYRYH